MQTQKETVPDSTAVRVALWRALHVMVDSPPHLIQDDLGLKMVAPEEGWRERPDMHPQWTAPFRASIVARARFIEDFLKEEIQKGVGQYVILGAGLDTFSQRNPELASRLQVFEIDKPATQEWKKRRLVELGHQIPANVHFVPVDFEARQSWWAQLAHAGFDFKKPAVVTSIGVSMYLTKEAIRETLSQMSGLAPGSQFIMTFLLPLEMVDSQDQQGFQMSIKGAQASGTPFVSFFSPEDMMQLARDEGFRQVRHLSTAQMTSYFAGRADGLRPSTGEVLLIASTL